MSKGLSLLFFGSDSDEFYGSKLSHDVVLADGGIQGKESNAHEFLFGDDLIQRDLEQDRETLILGLGKLARDRGQFEARALHLKRDTSEIDRLSEGDNPPTRDLGCLRDHPLDRGNPVRNPICRDLKDPIAPRGGHPVLKYKVGMNPGQFLRNPHED